MNTKPQQSCFYYGGNCLGYLRIWFIAETSFFACVSMQLLPPLAARRGTLSSLPTKYPSSIVTLKVKVNSLSRVWLFAALWTVTYQAPLSMEFSRQEYWSGLPFPSPGDLPDPGIEPGSPALQVDPLISEPPGKPLLSLWLTTFLSGFPPRWRYESWSAVLCVFCKYSGCVTLCSCMLICVFWGVQGSLRFLQDPGSITGRQGKWPDLILTRSASYLLLTSAFLAPVCKSVIYLN